MAHLSMMANEPIHEEIPEDANLPATKRDVALLKKGMQQEIDDVRGMIREEIAVSEKRMLSAMKAMRDEIFRHFDVAVENIEEAMSGANADEISSMKDSLDGHENRLQTVERRLALR